MAAEAILVVDDEKLIRWSICEALAARGHDTREAGDTREALSRASGASAIVLDDRLPDGRGIELVPELAGRAPVIFMTAHGDMRQAVAAMRAGAFHYLQKPLDLDEVCSLVDEAVGWRRDVAPADLAVRDLVGRSPAFLELTQRLARAASSSATTLLVGETGTGKNRLARAIHDGGPRRGGPFVHIACGSIPEALAESELFGHEAGSFTGATGQRIGLLENAHGGTVFFDEIRELSPSVQAKLLRFLTDGSFRRVGGIEEIRPDVRVLASSHAPVERAVAERLFREDLYFRIAVLEIDVPPLRERTGDIPLLAEHFLGKLARGTLRVSPGAKRKLESYAWPGNLRELRNVLERALVFRESRELRARDIVLPELAAQDSFTLPPGGIDIEAFEREMLRQALERTGGHRTRAAELLGLSRDAVRYRIAKYAGKP